MNPKVSLDLLVSAIDIDQDLKLMFTSELLKSKKRTTLSHPRHLKTIPFHCQRTLNVTWNMGDRTITQELEVRAAAQSIVAAHFQATKSVT
ncbi:hypothetical protein BY458DRAFT_526683 [Sporodiniella umbellata]|nr:hypothetical protein BY458DRAFT_526683 [Sporodiniella umbellata]